MAFKSDIEIAQEAKLKSINDIAASLGIPEEAVENYGRYKAKLDPRALKELPEKAKIPVIYTISSLKRAEQISFIILFRKKQSRYSAA